MHVDDRWWRVLIGAAMMTVTLGCGRKHLGHGLAPETAFADDEVVLEVENHNWADINVYIIHDGRRDRLTSVTATRDASLPIPEKFQGETGVFRLAVYRIGGNDSFTSDPVSIRTGYTVRLTVESDLAHSSVGVW